MNIISKALSGLRAMHRDHGLIDWTVYLYLFGFPTTIIVGSYIGLGESRVPSIAIRLIEAGFALALLLRSPLAGFRRPSAIIFGAFYSIAIFRLIFDLLVDGRTLWGDSPSLTIFFVLGAVGFWSLVGALRPPRLPSGLILGFLGIVLFLAVLAVGRDFRTLSEEGLRSSAGRLHPILMATVSALVGLLAVAKFAVARNLKEKILSGVIIAIAVIGLVLPATRSLTLSFLAATVLAGISMWRHQGKRVSATLIGFGPVSLLMLGALAVTMLGGISIFDRIASVSLSEYGTYTRSYMVPLAFRTGILDFPVFGVSYGLPQVGYADPHNIYAQAFLGFGVIGGLLASCVFALGTILSAWRVVKLPLDQSWPCLLTFVMLLTANFSYPILFEPAFMAMLGLSLSAAFKSRSSEQLQGAPVVNG